MIPSWAEVLLVNVNPETGIRYGIISLNSLEPWWWQDVAWEGTDVSHKQAFAEEFPELVDLDEEDWPDGAEERVQDWNELYECDEPVYEGKTDGVKWRTTWLGGAPLLWVFESPHITRARPCSPCVPNAGDLDNLDPEHGVETYTVPAEWLYTPED